MYSASVNGLLSKIFYVLQTFVLCIHFEAENFPSCNGKTLYRYIMFTDSRQESLESKVRDEISFLLGGIKVFSTGLNELYLPKQLTV
jgi:hypothetical protein